MDLQYTLIRIYLFVCQHYQGRLAATAQRQSNNDQPDFTDEEVLTIYLFGLFKNRETVSDIHQYAEDHFSDWFPDLPSYQSYNRRLNRLSAVFAPLVQEVLSEVSCQKTRKQVVRIADSMPIMLAKGQRASRATVASDQLASVGYCSSKNTFFHGVKLHVVAQRRSGTLPLLEKAGLTPGSENDLRALRRVLPKIEGGVLCGDKAYCDGPLKEQLAEETYNFSVKRGHADRYSTINWIEGNLGSRLTKASVETRLLGEETVLGLTGAAGFVTLLGAHVLATGARFSVLGTAITTEGTFSWPMLMQAYIPLGAEPGGIMPAVVGTVWLVIGASLFALPLGVGAAVFLTEYAEQGRFTAVVEIATNALWSTPSIVFGLFGAAFLIPRLGGNESLLAGMLVLGFMLLPLVLITSRESILAVPDEYRDASAALGVSRWETIRSVVLPAAMPGVITGGILGIGRIAGETAPLILVLGSTLNATEPVKVLQGFRFVAQPPFIVNDQLLAASASLPTQVWAVIAAGVSGSPQMGWATAAILLSVVLTFYGLGITARTYFRRKLNYE